MSFTTQFPRRQDYRLHCSLWLEHALILHSYNSKILVSWYSGQIFAIETVWARKTTYDEPACGVDLPVPYQSWWLVM